MISVCIIPALQYMMFHCLGILRFIMDLWLICQGFVFWVFSGTLLCTLIGELDVSELCPLR